MKEYILNIYANTGEYFSVVDFTALDVDWNVLYNLTKSGCHCIWVESDLESYIKVYGEEKHCVHTILENLEDYLGELK